jgi:hypothetical protein
VSVWVRVVVVSCLRVNGTWFLNTVLVLVRHDVVVVGCPRVWIVTVQPAVIVAVVVLLQSILVKTLYITCRENSLASIGLCDKKCRFSDSPEKLDTFDTQY